MDKQKQIEGVRQDLADINGTDGIHILGYIPLAKNLIEKGYRKIPENAVVLTREQYEILLSNADNAFQDGLNESRDLYEQEVKDEIRKETAEKFAEMLKEYFKEKGGIYYKGKQVAPDLRVIQLSKIDEICKEITEGK